MDWMKNLENLFLEMKVEKLMKYAKNMLKVQEIKKEVEVKAKVKVKIQKNLEVKVKI